MRTWQAGWVGKEADPLASLHLQGSTRQQQQTDPAAAPAHGAAGAARRARCVVVRREQRTHKRLGRASQQRLVLRHHKVAVLVQEVVGLVGDGACRGGKWQGQQGAGSPAGFMAEGVGEAHAACSPLAALPPPASSIA